MQSLMQKGAYMSLPKKKPHYSVSRLKVTDQKEVTVIETAIANLLSDQVLCEYITSRKERCDLGKTQAKLLEEQERVFISFLKEQASEYIGALIEDKIMSYENGDNEPYKLKAISSINKGTQFAVKSATTNK